MRDPQEKPSKTKRGTSSFSNSNHSNYKVWAASKLGDLKLITNPEERKKVVTDIQYYLIRCLYKMAKILPFNNQLLSSDITHLFPDSFNIDNFAMTVKKFDTIIKPEEFWKGWEELEKWQSKKDDLYKLFLENDCDIVKLYSDKHTNNNPENLLLCHHDTSISTF